MSVLLRYWKCGSSSEDRGKNLSVLQDDEGSEESVSMEGRAKSSLSAIFGDRSSPLPNRDDGKGSTTPCRCGLC